MIVETTVGTDLDSELLSNYFKNLVNRFFKIIPIREQNSDTLNVYLESLLKELLGCKSLIIAIQNDSMFLSLLSSLQYLIDHPDDSIKAVKRQVFNSISICNKLKKKYSDNVSDNKK